MAGVSVLRGALNGDGDGNGDGYGYGYGDGYGDGGGYGGGYDNSEYWRLVLFSYVQGWNETQRTRLQACLDAQIPLAYWRSNADGQPSNNGRALPEPATAGVRHTASGPLRLCHAGTLHATLVPLKWQGERVWIVALHGEVVGDDEKFGCLEREILGECVSPI